MVGAVVAMAHGARCACGGGAARGVAALVWSVRRPPPPMCPDQPGLHVPYMYRYYRYMYRVTIFYIVVLPVHV